MIMDGYGHRPGRHLEQRINLQPFGDFTTDQKNMVTINRRRRYQIKGLISNNYFGRVYKAIQYPWYKAKATKNVNVTIQVINFAPAKSALYKRAENEIKYLRKLKNSKNVITFRDWHEKGSTVIIKMKEYCTRNLFKRMEAATRYGLLANRVISIFLPLLSNAVREMRSKKIVHLDLNPSNILQWAGFDLAESIDDGEELRFQSPRGTPGYTDPDALYNGIATSKSDLYSVGAILYTVATGKKHSQGTTVSFTGSDDYEKWHLLWDFIRKLLNHELSLPEFYKYANKLVEIVKVSDGPQAKNISQPKKARWANPFKKKTSP